MSATAADLTAAIGAHQLLPSRALRELQDVLVARFPDPDALAAEMRRRGWLTGYQLDRLARGEGEELVLGPYRILEPLGRGGMGQVFKARHALMGRIVAVKLVRPELLDRPEARRRFLREIKAAGRLSHPNVVTTHDAQQVKGRVFLVMEFCEGTDLARLVEEAGPLPIGTACEFARQVALGLAHIHRHGLIHRDLKPQNLLLTGGTVKILDLGLARRIGEAAPLTGTGEILGTPDYLAPEQAGDPRQVDGRADMYALGCTLYFLIAGEAPFAGGTGIEKLLRHRLEDPARLDVLRDDTPEGVRAIVAKLMAKDPSDRYPTGDDAAAALDQWAAEPTPVQRDSRTPRPVPREQPTLTAAPAGIESASTNPEVSPGKKESRTAVVEDDVTRRQKFTRRAVIAGVAGAGVGLGGLAAAIWGWPPLLSKKTSTWSPPGQDPEGTSPTPVAVNWRAGAVFQCPERGYGTFAVCFDPKGTDLGVGCAHLMKPLGSPGPVYRLLPDRGQWARLGAHPQCAISRVAFTPDGRTLVCATGVAPHHEMAGIGDVVLWNSSSKTPTKVRIELSSSVFGLTVDPTGQWAAAANRGQLVTFDPRNGAKVHESKVPFQGVITCLAASPDGSALACGHGNGLVQLVDPTTHETKATYLVPPEDVRAGRGLSQFWGLAYRPDRSLVGTVWVQDDTAEIRTWIADRAPMRLPESKVYAMALAPDGKTLATGGQDERVRVWDLDTRQLLFTGTPHREPIYGVAFDRTGRRLASCSSNGTVRLWEAA